MPLAVAHLCDTHSQVGVEFVATIGKSAHRVRCEAVVNVLSLSFFEHGVAILVYTEAEIVLDVRRELQPIHWFIIKEVGLLLEQAQNHGLGVRVSVYSAVLRQLLCRFHLWIAFDDLPVGAASEVVGLDRERLHVGRPGLGTVKTHISSLFHLIIY